MSDLGSLFSLKVNYLYHSYVKPTQCLSGNPDFQVFS